MINVSAIKKLKIKKGNVDNIEHSLQEYQKIAEHIVINKYPHLFNMVKDEDFLAYLVNHLVLSDYYYNEELGHKKYFRSLRVLYAAKSLMSLNKNFNEKIKKTLGKQAFLTNTFVNKKSKNNSKHGLGSFYEHLEHLNPVEKDILIQRYQHDISFLQIAKNLNLTREQIKVIHDKALNNIKYKYYAEV